MKHGSFLVIKRIADHTNLKLLNLQMFALLFPKIMPTHCASELFNSNWKNVLCSWFLIINVYNTRGLEFSSLVGKMMWSAKFKNFFYQLFNINSQGQISCNI